MGLRYRKRSKGKSDWWNFSISKSGGFRASKSVKMGDTTFNISKNGIRTTHNFGNGWKWVSNPKKKKTKTKTPKNNTYKPHKSPSATSIAATKKAQELKLQKYLKWYATLSEEDQVKEYNKLKAKNDKLQKELKRKTTTEPNTTWQDIKDSISKWFTKKLKPTKPILTKQPTPFIEYTDHTYTITDEVKEKKEYDAWFETLTIEQQELQNKRLTVYYNSVINRK